jgi:hypothetical protein
VGENPVDIVATPGGVAAFVASAGGPGRHAITALPSSCVLPPRAGGPRPDLALWPTCALPSAPGRLAVLIDPPDASGRIRETCASVRVEPDELPTPLSAAPPEAVTAADLGCEADLRQETEPPGRRKLAVTLPDLGQLWVLDAQRVLDVAPGSFPACADVALERMFDLPVTVPDPLPAQDPGDLAGAGACLPPLSFGPAPDTYHSRPAGVELRDDVLYLGDLGVPLIHRLDVADPCAPAVLPPLVPRCSRSRRGWSTPAPSRQPPTPPPASASCTRWTTPGDREGVRREPERHRPHAAGAAAMRYSPFEIPESVGVRHPGQGFSSSRSATCRRRPGHRRGHGGRALRSRPGAGGDGSGRARPSRTGPTGSSRRGLARIGCADCLASRCWPTATSPSSTSRSLDAPCRRPCGRTGSGSGHAAGCRVTPSCRGTSSPPTGP